jgi:hypothetical protein
MTQSELLRSPKSSPSPLGEARLNDEVGQGLG